MRVEQLEAGSAVQPATIQGHLTNPVSWEHGGGTALPSDLFQLQLDWSEYQVQINDGRDRKPGETIFIEMIHRGRVVMPIALPGLTIDLNTLWDA